MTSNRRLPHGGVPTTWLFTPGTDPDRFDAAARAGAGVAILDLEDAVAPDDKDCARALVVQKLTALRDSASVVRYAVRMNAVGSVAGLRDLLAVAEHRLTPDYVVIPKVEAAATVDLVAEILHDAGVVTDLVAMIESARAVTEITAILREGRTPPAAVMFGAADMAGDLGAEPGTAVLEQARNSILHAAAAFGVPVVDTPFFDVHDADGLTDSVADAVRSGFAAKAAIHPRQIDAIADGFTPSGEEIRWATEVVQVAERGVGTVNGQMIDEAIARRARRILARAN